MKIIRKSNLLLLVILLMLPLVLWIGNHYFHNNWLPARTVLSMLLLMSIFFLMLYNGFYLLFSKGWKRRVVGCSLLAITYFFMFDVVYWAIYELYPRWGVTLFDPEKAFHRKKFESKILKNSFVLFGLALASAIYRKLRMEISRRYSVEEDLKVLASNYHASHIYTHFVESITSTAISRSLFKDQDGKNSTIEKFAAVMRYVKDMQAIPFGTVSLEKEWKMVQQLVSVALWKYGDQKVVLAYHGKIDPSWLVVPVSLLTLVENCLKYADLRGDGAIYMELSVNQHGYDFACYNPFDPMDSERLTGERFGVENLRMRLENSGYDVTLDIDVKPNYYTARIRQRITSVP